MSLEHMVLSSGKMAVTSLLQLEYKGKPFAYLQTVYSTVIPFYLLFFFNKLRFISMLFKTNKPWIKWRKGIKKNVNPLKNTHHMTFKKNVDTITDVPPSLTPLSPPPPSPHQLYEESNEQKHMALSVFLEKASCSDWQTPSFHGLFTSLMLTQEMKRDPWLTLTRLSSLAE